MIYFNVLHLNLKLLLIKAFSNNLNSILSTMENILTNNPSSILAQTFQASINDFLVSSTRTHFSALFETLISSQ